MGRQPYCEKVVLKRGPWTLEEDSKLINFILNNGIQCWRLVPKPAGLMRCGKSCRLRWINYLRPDLKRGAFTDAEEDMIIELHSRLGNRWSKISAHFPGRTDNEIKNQWNTRIKKKMRLMGLDPFTHRPIIEQENLNSVGEINEEGETDQNLEIQENVKLPPLTDYYQNTITSDSNYSILENSDIAYSSSMFQMKEPIGNFSVGPIQNWMDNPFIWDGFNSLGDSFHDLVLISSKKNQI